MHATSSSPTPLPQPHDEAQTERQIESEIDEYLYIREQRRRILPRAVLVGLLAGAMAVAFRAALAVMDAWRLNLIAWAHQFDFGWIFPLGLGALGMVIAVGLVRIYAPEASGSGIPHLDGVLRRYREMRWRRLLPVKFVGGVVALGSGLALGREGPTVQMGGAVGAAVSEFVHVTARERLTLIAAGAGAGLAAAFNAPLAGFIFVLEELQRDFRRGVFAASLIAAAVADIVARSFSGQLPVFAVPSYPAPPLAALPAFVLLGVVTGLLGVFFNRALIVALDLFAQVPARRVLWVAAALGGAVGLVGWFAPEAGGSGHALTESVLLGQIALGAVPAWFATRFLMTTASYSTGSPGGIFTPLLVLGALIGLGVGQLMHLLLPTVVTQPGAFAVVGMAAYFAAIVRAPLTGVVLILEMTGNYWQLLPLMTACLCAYMVAEHLRDTPIYERLLERELIRSGMPARVEQPMVVEVEVEPESPFEGKLVRDLGLPAGCILVAYRDEHQSQIPTAATRLTAHMRLTAMIAPGADNSLMALREGCEARE
ncbi:MAG: H(+)/Cl(-) exchange transporter ClcA [Caldilineaceae bacterium]|nr:H(+)/Cl(-) exchange transporter ClcA [Caldilineaceae bacterium]